jgi:hypothetical protein
MEWKFGWHLIYEQYFQGYRNMNRGKQRILLRNSNIWYLDTESYTTKNSSKWFVTKRGGKI